MLHLESHLVCQLLAATAEALHQKIHQASSWTTLRHMCVHSIHVLDVQFNGVLFTNVQYHTGITPTLTLETCAPRQTTGIDRFLWCE